MSQENVEDQEELRELLYFYLNTMAATQVELSKGMDVSRPVVINFLNKGKKQRLPVDRKNLIQLCKSLQEGGVSKKKLKTEIESNQQETKSNVDELPNPEKMRDLLGKIGVDELLESAGFLPEKTKIIRVTPERFFQVAQVVALLEFLEFEDLVSTTQEFLAIASNKIAIASKKFFRENQNSQEKDCLKSLIDSLKNDSEEDKTYPTLGLKLRLEVIDKLQRTWRRLKAGGKIDFTQQEAIRLFMSIAIKEQMPKNVPNLHIRVQKTEFQTLSKSINVEDDYKDLYDIFVQRAYKAEYDLKAPDSDSEIPIKSNFFDLLNPVIMAIVTCSFSYNEKSQELIEWIYTSGNTILENAIGACSLHLGLTEDISNINISTKTLDSSIDSLVETTVMLGNEQNYQGIWVDRDSMITMLQAIVYATKQWLADQSIKNQLDIEIYVSACKALADLRKRLTKVRKAFQNFQFLDDECKPAEINKIADIAKDELKKLPKENIYFSYRLNFYRCYFVAKRLELRLSNTQGNISNLKSLIEEIKKVIEEDEDVKKELVPIQALIQSEIYLYELSCGHKPDLFESRQRSKWLELESWKSKIESATKQGSCYKDPGLDIYKALSEIYGNAARIEFYLSDDKEILEKAAEDFLRAAHYALRIGSTQRVTRWLALAGRVWVRLGDSQLSIQAYKLADKLANADLTTGHSQNFREAVLSEIYLLRGEYLLLIQNEPINALVCFLKSLKGSVYLGLNRRICDALFDISRCSKKLGNFSTKEGITRVFMQEDQLTESNKGKLNPTSNRTSEKVLDLLYLLWNREDNPSWFQIQGEFSKLATDIWQGWHTDTSDPETITKHPIAKRIEDESWLCQIN
ncbi:hypothetical protein [Nostoc sp. ChiQUE01b]|uniref:hypothetical protein n=1 Tax=Nostoc sp. ChiQUE01b TaxID=3075376 RepID=UPI002AD1F58E|nr:hypothetical protein [Nostoc sp. ChiQUE01b]MDZ8258443.1 hypothetical protein [Nostoc sp. ChiQUE01b]